MHRSLANAALMFVEAANNGLATQNDQTPI
jgi:hypothetical protein